MEVWMMNILFKEFKDINPGMYPAKISSIKEERGPYGSYLRFNFTITEGELKGVVLLWHC